MKYWFKRRKYGWGWVPVTWQGWAAITTYLFIVIGFGTTLDTSKDTWSTELSVFLLVALIATVLLLVISYKHGPTPKWRWGSSQDDNPEEGF